MSLRSSFVAATLALTACGEPLTVQPSVPSSIPDKVTTSVVAKMDALLQNAAPTVDIANLKLFPHAYTMPNGNRMQGVCSFEVISQTSREGNIDDVVLTSTVLKAVMDQGKFTFILTDLSAPVDSSGEIPSPVGQYNEKEPEVLRFKVSRPLRSGEKVTYVLSAVFDKTQGIPLGLREAFMTTGIPLAFSIATSNTEKTSSASSEGQLFLKLRSE